MSGCKYVDGAYLNDGEPCRVDDYGDPTRHCQARATCAQHVGPNEFTCARCLRRVRADIRSIVARSCELLPAAIHARRGGVNTESFNLAGPAADVEAWSWRKIAARQGRAWHTSLIEDDDERHPFTVLTTWQWQLTIAYQHPGPEVYTVSDAAAYLERQLPRLAQDPEQDFRQFAKEISTCLGHLEAVLRDSLTPERGAPCPTCPDPRPLQLERGHHCTDPECDRIHYPEDPDRYVCPKDRTHWWTAMDYRKWVDDVYEANKVPCP